MMNDDTWRVFVRVAVVIAVSGLLLVMPWVRANPGWTASAGRDGELLALAPAALPILPPETPPWFSPCS